MLELESGDTGGGLIVGDGDEGGGMVMLESGDAGGGEGLGEGLAHSGGTQSQSWRGAVGHNATAEIKQHQCPLSFEPGQTHLKVFVNLDVHLNIYDNKFPKGLSA
jgi:hypothetical protein